MIESDPKSRSRSLFNYVPEVCQEMVIFFLTRFGILIYSSLILLMINTCESKNKMDLI